MCKGKLGYEFDGDIIPGTEIYPGIFTGMSREDAKRLTPNLVGREATVELFPGKRVLGEIYFENYRRHGVSQIHFTGRPVDSPAGELTKRFGSPLTIDAGMIAIHAFNNWMPSPPERFQVLKWCDGPRIYVLRVDEERFDLSISGPRTHN